MRAIVVVADGVACDDIVKPSPGPGQVLVQVKASALNRADLIVASGASHGSSGGGGAGTVMGGEFSGDVVEIGDDVSNVSVGDRVMCFGTGGYAEFAVIAADRALKIPDPNISYEVAATLPVGLVTLHNALVTRGRLQSGEKVLIQGASSGVGLMGLQIAKYMGASQVFGTSTHAGRRARLGEFGADVAIDSSDPDWPQQVLSETDGQGVDLIIDMVSAGVANENMKAASLLGRIVNVGRLGGATGEFDFNLHALKRIEYIGVTFRTRTPEEVRAVFKAMREDLWPAVASGALRLPIDKLFKLEEAGAALEHMATNNHFGKVLLVP
jgi:NADPH:quinone reductase